ncbi:NADP-dependent oxidoreductase domain-containing protein [Infundibulicybe gibba]|nr:NADP-dependent oxidoreductase domain-containing protein [Infundibulicybe gibba]
MSIGDKWEAGGMGSMNKESSFKLLDAYYDNGGNFIDTASNYQDESSEMFIGEWAEKRGIRDQLFIATKYSSNFKRRDPSVQQKVLHVGNSNKNLHVSVEASLKKLRTTYIDLLYVHWWDFVTSVEEVMNSLHHLVAQGKVLYLGISDTPAWIVSRANQYARDHGKTQFSVYQGAWSILESEGMALAPWNVLASGKLRTDEEEKQRRETGEKGRMIFGQEWERNEMRKRSPKRLRKLRVKLGRRASLQVLAIAYVMQKTPFVFPIIGGRKIEHLMSNIEALDIALTAEQIAYLESILPFDIGFPATMVGTGKDYSSFLKNAAHVDLMPLPTPIRPEGK